MGIGSLVGREQRNYNQSLPTICDNGSKPVNVLHFNHIRVDDPTTSYVDVYRILTRSLIWGYNGEIYKIWLFEAPHRKLPPMGCT